MPLWTLRPNRISAGQAFSLFDLAAPELGALFAALLSLIAVGLRASRAPVSGSRAAWVGALTLGLALPWFFVFLDYGAGRLLLAAPGSARISLSLGAFLAVAALAALPSRVFPKHAASSPRLRTACRATAALGLGLLLLLGRLGNLSITRELALRSEEFGRELARHALYALIPSLAAFLVGVPVGRAAARSRLWERAAFFVANGAQAIPTMALLGFLMIPLAALGRSLPILGSLGLGGIGWAPAGIALFLYALLPILANSYAGFRMVDPAVTDAARGMGMDRRGLFWRIELPLAAPQLWAGLRTAAAQNTGNAILAGLVGGGGLGRFLFLGLAQAAPDLVLLASLAVAGAAYVIDLLVAWPESRALARLGRGGTYA